MPLADLRTLPPLAQATPRVVGATVKNMVRAGALVPAGQHRLPHCTKWVQLYDLPPDTEATAEPPAGDAAVAEAFVDLGRVFDGWLRGEPWGRR